MRNMLKGILAIKAHGCLGLDKRRVMIIGTASNKSTIEMKILTIFVHGMQGLVSINNTYEKIHRTFANTWNFKLITF